MNEDNRSDAMGQGSNAARSVLSASGKTVVKTAKGLINPGTRHLTLFFLLLLFLLILVILVAGTSQSQMAATYYLTANQEDNGWNEPAQEEKENAIWDRQTSIDQSDKLMAILTQAKENEKENRKSEIIAFCQENGYDASESLAHLQESTPVSYIEGDSEESSSYGATTTDMEILSAYSIALSNAEFTKVDGFFARFFAHIREKYVNEKDFEISVIWLGEKGGSVDYEKDLQKRVDDFVSRGGTFYNLDYERENGQIKVYTKVVTLPSGESDSPDASNTGGGSTEEGETTVIIQYVVPILTEKNVTEISQDLFQLDPNEEYVNDDGSKVTNQEAITTLTEYTAALLYDANIPAGRGINISDLSGEFAWPAPGITYITSLFGNRYHPVYHTARFHDGVDIGTPTGTPIVACDDGVVTLTGMYGGYGYTVIVQHENGLSTLYGHLSIIQVKKGQKVEKGQQIALSGNSGVSTGPHLHLSVFLNGTAVDPVGYILTPESYGQMTIAQN